MSTSSAPSNGALIVPSGTKLLGEILVEFGFITEGALLQVIAESAGAGRFDPRTSVVDPEVLAMVPKEVAARYKVLPVAVVGVLTYLEPAFAVVWAAVFLSEEPDPLAWFGGALVVAGGGMGGGGLGAAGAGGRGWGGAA